MTSRTPFISGRTGPGSAFVSDRSGSSHDRFMRLSSWIMMPLSVAVAFLLASVAANPSYPEARAILGQPAAAIALIAFGLVGTAHAYVGAESIITDYVHDAQKKALAFSANKIAAILMAGVWTVAIGVIAAPR